VKFVVQVFISDELKHASIARGEASRPLEGTSSLLMTRAGSFLVISVKGRTPARREEGAGGIRREVISMFYFTLYVKGSFQRDPSRRIVARDE
jgi:hypothetical protein